MSFHLDSVYLLVLVVGPWILASERCLDHSHSVVLNSDIYCAQSFVAGILPGYCKHPPPVAYPWMACPPPFQQPLFQSPGNHLPRLAMEPNVPASGRLCYMPGSSLLASTLAAGVARRPKQPEADHTLGSCPVPHSLLLQ